LFIRTEDENVINVNSEEYTVSVLVDAGLGLERLKAEREDNVAEE
jgi:hypothetical protein